MRIFKTPYISKDNIKIKADLFRKKLWDDSIPVDIEKIIDVKLKIDIIPLPGLEQNCGTDAFISSDWKSVCIDKRKFLDNRNRLRFSLAHEIGHFVLHKSIYSKFKITDLKDFYDFMNKMPVDQYGYLESQANSFANFLLVPRDRLLVEKEKALNKIKKAYNIDINKIDQKTLYSYMAIPISMVFGVSEKVIEIALSDN